MFTNIWDSASSQDTCSGWADMTVVHAGEAGVELTGTSPCTRGDHQHVLGRLVPSSLVSGSIFHSRVWRFFLTLYKQVITLSPWIRLDSYQCKLNLGFFSICKSHLGLTEFSVLTNLKACILYIAESWPNRD